MDLVAIFDSRTLSKLHFTPQSIYFVLVALSSYPNLKSSLRNSFQPQISKDTMMISRIRSFKAIKKQKMRLGSAINVALETWKDLKKKSIVTVAKTFWLQLQKMQWRHSKQTKSKRKNYILHSHYFIIQNINLIPFYRCENRTYYNSSNNCNFQFIFSLFQIFSPPPFPPKILCMWLIRLNIN